MMTLTTQRIDREGDSVIFVESQRPEIKSTERHTRFHRLSQDS